MNADGPFPQFSKDDLVVLERSMLVLMTFAEREDAQHVAVHACRDATLSVHRALRAVRDQQPLDERARG